MTIGRVEVYHDEDFLNKKTRPGAGALVGRFTCQTEKLAEDQKFIDFCKLVCRHLYDAEGDPSNFTKEQATQILELKKELETKFKEKIELTDHEYIVL